jgi:hypothetical protein
MRVVIGGTVAKRRSNSDVVSDCVSVAKANQKTKRDPQNSVAPKTSD